LQHDRGFLDGAAATQCVLELLAPLLELGGFQIEFLDDGDLFSAPVFFFQSHDGAFGTRVRYRNVLLHPRWKVLPKTLELRER
jgi:hypothetical protein